MKLLGYFLLGFGSWACYKAGLRIDMWEFWAIMIGFIFGSKLTNEDEW